MVCDPPAGYCFAFVFIKALKLLRGPSRSQILYEIYLDIVVVLVTSAIDLAGTAIIKVGAGLPES